MEILFTDVSKKEFINLDDSLRKYFIKALNKLKTNSIRRHLRYGIPCHVIPVYKQSRIIYEIKDDTVIILHCFSSHKDYEKWYKSY